MESLLWHLTNRTAETLLILSVFHLLLAGLMLMVLLYQRLHRAATGRPDRLVAIGIGLLMVNFAVLAGRFGLTFFFREQSNSPAVDRGAHALLGLALVCIAAGYLDSAGGRRLRILIPAFPAIGILALLDGTVAGPHSAAMFLSDLVAAAALLMGLAVVIRGECRWAGRGARLVGLSSLVLVIVLHGAPAVFSGQIANVFWNLEEHLMSLALFALTWAVGERSRNLLDRVFIRLNLTFLVLASLIMLITAGMQKYQYFRLAEQRSVNLAEFLRGHVIYYGAKGENLEQIFNHPEVLRRVVTEFGNLPELREVNVYLQGEHAAFRYGRDWEVKESISPAPRVPANSVYDLQDEFSMIRLPVREGSPDRIEFIGTLDYVNEYIGRYIILIYCSFTLMVGLGTLVIGMIVADADDKLKKQYAELQETQQQLAQSAKLASIGELAGGMAHEINNPITGILALASHMAEGNNAGALNARARRNLEIIVRQTERVAGLVRGLLTFSRQTQLHFEPVRVGEVLDTALDLVRYRLSDGAVRVAVDIERGMAPVTADSSRLTEVLVNLLSNALDAMPSGGLLTVRAHSAAAGGVHIEIQDTGEGIAPELLARIFDPFFTTKAPGRGTGLGLSISHGIIKDHGGEIWAQSSPGAGTTMTVVLPDGTVGNAGAMTYEEARAGH